MHEKRESVLSEGTLQSALLRGAAEGLAVCRVQCMLKTRGEDLGLYGRRLAGCSHGPRAAQQQIVLMGVRRQGRRMPSP